MLLADTLDILSCVDRGEVRHQLTSRREATLEERRVCSGERFEFAGRGCVIDRRGGRGTTSGSQRPTPRPRR